MKRQLLPTHARHFLISALGGVPQNERPMPSGREAVSAWIAAECIRDADARFSSRAAFAALRRYQSARMLPMPSRREFVRCAASLRLRHFEGCLVGLRPRDPACLEKAGIESIALWLRTRVELDAGASIDLRVAWSDYARSVAPRVPATGFEADLATRGFKFDGPAVQGMRLR